MFGSAGFVNLAVKDGLLLPNSFNFSFPAERLAVASERSGEPLSMYVHLPFCARRCAYCAFPTGTDRSLAGATLAGGGGAITRSGR